MFGRFGWKIYLEILFGNFVWKFCLDISFGYIGLMLAEKMSFNLVQRHLLISLTTLDSILSFAILTFWELIFGFGALFQIFLEWGSIRKQYRSPLI